MKKSLVAIALIVTAVAAHADVLYWMVSDAEAASATVSDESFAYLKASNAGSTVQLASLTGAQVLDLKDYSDQSPYTLGSPLTSPYTDWSFFVELAADGRKTDSMTYQQLVNAGYLSPAGSMAVPETLPAGFGQAAGTAYNIPEPTSGMLFLIGGVLLGLKRRRQV